MTENSFVNTNTLREWMESKKVVSIVDVREMQERAEWFIPQSVHYNAYDKLRAKDENALEGLHLDKSVPVVTVCAAGKTSQIAAALLKEKGYQAFSLQDGMKGWSLAWNQATIDFKGHSIVQLRRTGKGCLSYILATNGNAVIIDASLPAEVYKEVLKQNNWGLDAVMETHIHADHLSRSKQIADEFSVPLLLPVPNKVSFPFRSFKKDQAIQFGKLTFKVISTPGHTMESICLLVDDKVLFSGDTVFTHAVGRPDLKADEEEVKRRAELLYDSLHRLLELDENTLVLPAHTSSPVDFDGKPIQATIAEIKNNVPVLRLAKTDFVKTILDKLPPSPPNHLAIVERNLSGDLSGINPIDLEAGANRCAVA